MKSRGFPKQALAREPQRDRSAEFASYVKPEPRARMATARDLVPVDRARVLPAPRRAAQGRAAATVAEREYMGRVAALGCVICRLLGDGPTPAQVHHVREGQGAAQRAGNFCVLPLCEPHHTGTHGIHGDRRYMRILNVDEMDLLDMTIGELAR